MKNRDRTFAHVFWGLLLATILIVWTTPYSFPVRADPGAPDPGTVVGIVTREFPTVKLTNLITQTTTANIFDPAIGSTRFYNSADVFIGADFATTGFMTATVQLSPNGRDWATSYYNTVSSANVIARQTYRTSLSADGSDYMRLPLAGEFMRVQIQYSGIVTPTVRMTLRNN